MLCPVDCMFSSIVCSRLTKECHHKEMIMTNDTRAKAMAVHSPFSRCKSAIMLMMDSPNKIMVNNPNRSNKCEVSIGVLNKNFRPNTGISISIKIPRYSTKYRIQEKKNKEDKEKKKHTKKQKTK